jgi:hypothetical protein
LGLMSRCRMTSSIRFVIERANDSEGLAWVTYSTLSRLPVRYDRFLYSGVGAWRAFWMLVEWGIASVSM